MGPKTVLGMTEGLPAVILRAPGPARRPPAVILSAPGPCPVILSALCLAVGAKDLAITPHLSISPRTTSRDPMSAMMSAIIMPRERTWKMLMAVKQGLLTLTRYGFTPTPSETT